MEHYTAPDSVHGYTQLGEFASKASCAEVAVVGMRAEGDDTHA
jgi:hypothetical protein